MMGNGVKLDGDGSWECQHALRSGEPALSTRLRIDGMPQPSGGRPTSSRQRITCLDCGTDWRVWTDLRVAKPAVEWNPAVASRAVRRAPVLDIDRIIDVVAANLPSLTVVQHHDAWPADDEGVWFFRFSQVMTDIQLESSTGMCPFIIEHSGMPSAADAWTAASVEDAARMVVGYLRAVASARGGTAAG